MCKGLLTKVGRYGFAKHSHETEVERTDSPGGGGSVILLIIQRYYGPIN